MFVAGRYALSMPASRSDSVDFEVIDHRRGDASNSWLPPFAWTVDYENERWWDEPHHYYVGEPWFVQVLADGDEVARVELDDPGGINPQYVSVPKLRAERLEIQFIEVAAAARGRGIGTRVVRAIELRHPPGGCSPTARKRTGSGPRSAGNGSTILKESGSIGRCSSSHSSIADAPVAITGAGKMMGTAHR
ncbi:MAG: GNAT family N-acetyltransferase [Mycobacterium sp.]